MKNTSEPERTAYLGVGLSLDSIWISYASNNILWLPSEYQPCCSLVCGTVVGMGVGTGRGTSELPEPETAEQLFTCYMNTVHSSFPVIGVQEADSPCLARASERVLCFGGGCVRK
jgi:hypothetical protein